MTYAKQKTQLKLVISIGANIPGILGDPIRTIATMRPQIEKSIIEWNVALNRPKIDSQNIHKSLSEGTCTINKTNGNHACSIP